MHWRMHSIALTGMECSTPHKASPTVPTKAFPLADAEDAIVPAHNTRANSENPGFLKFIPSNLLLNWIVRLASLLPKIRPNGARGWPKLDDFLNKHARWLLVLIHGSFILRRPKEMKGFAYQTGYFGQYLRCSKCDRVQVRIRPSEAV